PGKALPGPTQYSRFPPTKEKPQPAGHTTRSGRQVRKPKRFGSEPPSPKPTQPEEEGVTSDDDEGEESPEIEDSESPAPEDSESPEPEDELQQQLHQEAEETEQLSQARTLADSIRAELEQQFAIQFAERLDE